MIEIVKMNFPATFTKLLTAFRILVKIFFIEGQR